LPPEAATTASPKCPRLSSKRAPIGSNRDDFDVLENGGVVGRIFLSLAAPQELSLVWASGHYS
jgi:hypothetical protein